MIQKTIMIQGKPFVYNDELSDIQYDGGYNGRTGS